MGKTNAKAKPRAPQLNPFDRRPNETDPAWKAFQCYRNMGEGRTLDKAREKLGRRPGYMRQLEEWSSGHEWVNRVRAWDDAEAAQLADWTQQGLEIVDCENLGVIQNDA